MNNVIINLQGSYLIFLSFQISFTFNKMAFNITSLYTLYTAKGTIITCLVILLSSAKVIAEDRNYSGWKQSILKNYIPDFNLIEDTLSPYMSIQLEILLLAVWAFRPKFSEIKILNWQLWRAISSIIEVPDDTFLYKQVLGWLQNQSAITTCCLLKRSYKYKRIANDNNKNTSSKTISPSKFIPMLNTKVHCQYNSTWFWIKHI